MVAHWQVAIALPREAHLRTQIAVNMNSLTAPSARAELAGSELIAFIGCSAFARGGELPWRGVDHTTEGPTSSSHLPAISVEAIMSSALTQDDVAAFEKRAAEAEARLDALESGSGAGARSPSFFAVHACAHARMSRVSS